MSGSKHEMAIRRWYCRLRRALALTGPVPKNPDYYFAFRSRSNPRLAEARRDSFLASLRANLEEAADDKTRDIDWLEEHWIELADTYELATKDIPVLRDVIPGIEPMRPSYLALRMLQLDDEWVADRLYRCERAEDEEWDFGELESRFRESDAGYPFKSEVVTELNLKLDEEKSHLLNCFPQIAPSPNVVTEPAPCDSAFAAAEVCEQIKELATEHRVIDEVAAMPVIKAVDAILGYMDRVQELRSKWTDVEAAGWLRGYQWDHPFRTASTATRSALEQAQANCHQICKWFDENTKTDPDAPLGQSMQEAIDLGDDMAPFIAKSIEAIKRRVPAECVTRIDEERRYILESATPHTAIASNESQTVDVPARKTIEDSFATLAKSIDKLTDSIPDKLSGVVPAKPKKALSLDELELPQVREMIVIADLHLQWLEAGQPKDGQLEAWLPEHGYQDDVEAFLKGVYDRDRKYKSDYKMALPTKGRPKREKAIANQKKWVNKLKSIESDLLA